MTDQPPTDHDFILGYLKVTLLGIIWVCVGMVVGHMQRGGLDRSRARGVARDPAGHVPFRDYAREVHARLNVTSGAMASPQQAAATQRGLVGLSRAIATRAPARVVNCSVVIQVHQADAVTYLLCPLSAKFENSDDERQRALGAALVDFRVERGERVDSVLTKLEMARLEADAAGFAIPNCQMLTLILFRAPGVGAAQASRPLQPSSRQMPGNQRQREQLLERARSYGHLAERAPGNAGGIFSGGRGHRAGIFIGATADAGSPAAGGIWADGGPDKTSALLGQGSASSDWANPVALSAYAPPTAATSPGKARRQRERASPFGSGTGADIASSTGAEHVGISDTPADYSGAQTAECAFLGHRRAKRRWRRFIEKPVGRMRRAVRRVFHRKGKGKGRGW